jgi:hypothetical protein
MKDLEWLMTSGGIFGIIAVVIGGVIIVTWIALPFIIWAKLSSIDYHTRSIHGMLNVVLNMGAGITLSTKKPQHPSPSQAPYSGAG